MESVLKAMQHPTTGVPVKSQKLFLTTVTNAFTGNFECLTIEYLIQPW
jgi:hypothetical protein